MSKRFAFVLTLVVYFNTAFSQSGSQSPYSRYGLGDIQYGGFTSQIAMGGFSITQNDSFGINYNNPASYAALGLTIFDGALRGEYNSYQISSFNGIRRNAGLSYLALGFPVISKKWGSSIGLIPFTSTGYNIQTTGLISDSVSYQNLYTGSGGLSRLYWGNGFHIARNLSLGFNTSYFFGSINKTRITEFTEPGFYNSESNINSTYGNLNFDFGGLFKTDSLFYVRKKNFIPAETDSITASGDTIKIAFNDLTSMQKKRAKAARWLRLNIGITGTFANNVTQHDEILNQTYKIYGGVPRILDTLLYEPNRSNKISLPAFFGAGISLQDYYHWLIGIDGSFQQWSKFSLQGANDSLEDAFRFALGGEIIPKFNSTKFWQRVTYRAGLRYMRTELNLNNTPINEYAFTFGFGFPVRKDNITAAFGNYFSRLNITFELGQRGTLKNDLLREQYIRIHIALNLTEQWFIKKKYY